LKVQVEEKSWILFKRYRKFNDLYIGLKKRFLKMKLPDFPPKQFFINEEDHVERKSKLEQFMKSILLIPSLAYSWEVHFFLEIKKNVQDVNVKKKTILAPLPDMDFDPTEIAVPWKILTTEGFEIIFATENGNKPKADENLVYPKDFITSQFYVEPVAKEFYLEMEQDPKFCSPIKWEEIDVTQYDALLLSGGHACGMRQYCESDVLQKKISEYWKLNKPVAAIGRGCLLLSRCKDETGKSILYNRKTTSLPKFLEDSFYLVSKIKNSGRYRIYEIYCEDEVRGNLENHSNQFIIGTSKISKGSLYDDTSAFVVEDQNYISGRWIGDAYLFGKKLKDKLY